MIAIDTSSFIGVSHPCILAFHLFNWLIFHVNKLINSTWAFKSLKKKGSRVLHWLQVCTDSTVLLPVLSCIIVKFYIVICHFWFIVQVTKHRYITKSQYIGPMLYMYTTVDQQFCVWFDIEKCDEIILCIFNLLCVLCCNMLVCGIIG